MKPLSDDELWAFVDSRQSWAYLTTIGRDGYPHSVALGYFQLDHELYCGVRANTRKTRNIAENPKVSLLLESGRSSPALIGVLFQGEAEVITDPGRLLDLKRRWARKKGEPEPDGVADGIAYIRVVPQKIVSWQR